jgi:hypothetical protein
MNITVNEQIVKAIYDNHSYTDEITAFLNEIIAAEIEKDEMNTELMDECTDLLYELQFGEEPDTDSVNKLLHIYKTQMNRARRKRQIVAAIMIMLIGTGALLQTNPAIAQQTKDMFAQIASVLGIAADDTDTGKSEIVSIYAQPAEDAIFTVKSEDEINTDNISIFAVDEHDFEKPVALSECKVNKEQIDSTHIMVTYSYEGCACSIVYTLEVE